MAVGFCWMTTRQSSEPRLARQVERLKERVTANVMRYSLETAMPLRALVTALIESAASASASGIVLDQARQVLCSQSDDQHVEALCEEFRTALKAQIGDARKELLKPTVAYPTQVAGPS
jgi:hypothetical protein